MNNSISNFTYLVSFMLLSGCLIQSRNDPITVRGCGTQNGTAVAVTMRFVTPTNVGKNITLAATSRAVTNTHHSVTDAPNVRWSKRYKNYKYGNGGAAIQNWILNSSPLHGQLYEKLVPVTAGDTILDPDDLFYLPDEDFTGDDVLSFCVNDSSGQSNIAPVHLTVANPSNYPMPEGIPNPGFGINEQAPADPAGWLIGEVAGYYYIDSDSADCSDNHSYGYPDQPRCTIANQSTIAPGAKMVLAPSNTPYVLANSSWHQINFSGTTSNPSWLVGNDRGPVKPIIARHPVRAAIIPADGTALRISGGNLRISGIIFDAVGLDHRNGGVDNVVIRHSEIKNNPARGGGGTVVGLSTGGNNVLAFANYVHDNGIVEAAGLSVERDIHGFTGINQHGYWILDNRCDENAGDCVQLGNNNTSSDVYIGRLSSHSEGENCVDIKDFNRVVVSESDCWDLRTVQYGNSGGSAQSFYVNDEGIQQNYVYLLKNRSWDTNGVNFSAANIGGKVYFIGNTSFASPSGYGITFGTGAGAKHVYFNTFSSSSSGMFLYISGSAQGAYIVGNVVDGVDQYQTQIRAASSLINQLDYNFYTDINGTFASGGSMPMLHAGLEAFQAAQPFEENSLEVPNPSFEMAEIYNFRLKNNSVLRSQIPASVVRSLPGITDLENDLGGNLRMYRNIQLQNQDFDVGAEFQN